MVLTKFDREKENLFKIIIVEVLTSILIIYTLFRYSIWKILQSENSN